MSLTLDQIMDAANDLPVSEREELVEYLLRSLNKQEEADIRAEWLALAEHRMAEVKAGKVKGIPAEEVMKTLLELRP